MAGRFGPVADPRREKTRTTNAARAITRIPTFAEAAAEHLDGLRKRIEQDTFRPASFATRERYLNRDIYSAPFKALRLDEIDGGMIVDRIRFLEKTRSKYVAQGWRMAVFALFEEQIPLKRLAENPVKDTYQPAQPNKDQRIRKKNGDLRKLDAAEIAAVWNASDPATDYGAITRLALLCGDRRGELGGMRWNELNDDCSLWTIPPRRHKRGSQTGEPHTLPLAPAAQAILLARKARRSDRPLVFGVSSPKGFVDWGREKGYLDKRLGFDRKWKFHDLRRTLTSGMRALGIAPHITRAVVNHAQPNDVEERHYIVERDANGVSIYEPQKAEALRTWADHVLRLAGDNVVKLAA
jgi:integrase